TRFSRDWSSDVCSSDLYTRTYYRPSELSGNSYAAMFTPLVAPGQTLRARVYLPEDAPDSARAALYVYDDNAGEYHQAEGQPLTRSEERRVGKECRTRWT